MIQRRLLLAVFAVVFLGCGDDPDSAVGRRLPGFRKVITHMQGQPAGKYFAQSLPAEARQPGLLMVYVDARGAYALEVASQSTVDLNPAFVYVGFDTPDPEGVAREVCEKAALTYRNPFKEKGWYRATGQ